MCEYCGCQALPAIAALTREHDLALGLVRSASAALRRGELGETRRICLELRALLGPHSAIEEQALFPVMAEDFPDQIAALVADHETIEAALADVSTSGAMDVAAQERLAVALDLLPGHILREQDGVFPAALSVLTPAQWDHLDAVRAELRPRRAS